ncbi:MAG: helix-turn-helix domain-containing protein [Oscillospiraceae bacterium]
MQCESSTLFKVSHISNQLRAHCPLANYGVFQYGSSVIILFRDWNDANVRTQSGFSEDWNALLTTLRQNKACMGISLLFSDVNEALRRLPAGRSRIEYRQAPWIRTAPPISTRNTIWRDMLEHYADTMPLEDTYTHYLDRLMDDNNSVCSNIKLLYYFLCSERNISLTAKHVHMHRNSVIYRIQKIQDISRAGSRRSGCPSAADDLVQDPRNDRPHPALGNAARARTMPATAASCIKSDHRLRPLSLFQEKAGAFFVISAQSLVRRRENVVLNDVVPCRAPR